MTKTEKIDEIIKLTREVSEDKNKKRLDRRLKQVRIGLLKAAPSDIDQMYNDIMEKGARQYYDEKAEQYKKNG